MPSGKCGRKKAEVKKEEEKTKKPPKCK